MTEHDKILASIRKRDAEIKGEIPGHWTAQIDRRNLLRMLDEAYDLLHRYVTRP